MNKVFLILSIVLLGTTMSQAQSAKSTNNPVTEEFRSYEKSVMDKLDLNSDQRAMLDESLIWHKIQMLKLKKETASTDPGLGLKIENQRTAFQNKVKSFLNADQQAKLIKTMAELREVKGSLNSGE
jgi:hypothetical protein